MRAARIVPGDTGGEVRVLDVPDPEHAPDQVLVRVVASALNRGEVLQVNRATSGEPAPIGVEFAGVVAAVGSKVSRWRVGDRVMGHGTGGQAEYVVASPLTIARVPDGVAWTAAAAFPNVYMTAHDALATNGRLAPGESVLVNAASSGIGIASIQIARALGAGKVIATTRSAAKAARLTELGVDAVIDTSSGDQVDAVLAATGGRGVDIVIDSVGGTVFEANLASMAVKGRLVNVGRLGSASATIDLNALWLRRLHLIGVTFRTRTEDERVACFTAAVRDLLTPFADGRIAPVIDRTYPITEIAEAHRYLATDQHFGKVVLSVDEAAVGDALATWRA